MQPHLLWPSPSSIHTGDRRSARQICGTFANDAEDLVNKMQMKHSKGWIFKILYSRNRLHADLMSQPHEHREDPNIRKQRRCVNEGSGWDKEKGKKRK